MAKIMYDLAELCGFNFEATTFPELFYFMFLAICGTAIIAGVIRMLAFIAFGGGKLLK